MTVKRQKITTYAWECRCERCGHEWQAIAKTKPIRCAKCKAPGWERPARAYKRKAGK